MTPRSALASMSPIYSLIVIIDDQFGITVVDQDYYLWFRGFRKVGFTILS
jgi:hypothetical protein